MTDDMAKKAISTTRCGNSTASWNNETEDGAVGGMNSDDGEPVESKIPGECLLVTESILISKL